MSPQHYRRLDAAQIVSTLRSLRGRIERRFPGAGLGGVCGELWDIAEEAPEFILSLTSKIAALYLEGFDDHVVIGAVNEIEELAAGLSMKIWQKIMILDRVAVEP